MYKQKYAALVAALTLCVSAPLAHADTITAQTAFDPNGAFAVPYYGCAFEYFDNTPGCDYSVNGTFSNTWSTGLSAIDIGFTGGQVGLSEPGANFGFDPITDVNTGLADDYIVYDLNTSNLDFPGKPLTISFLNSGATGVQPVDGFATTIYYPFGPYTVVANAYDSQGNLIGSLDFASQLVSSTGEYTAFVGLTDTPAGPSQNLVGIASVVITTQDTPFTDDILVGTMDISPSPEPAGLFLAAVPLMMIGLLRRRRRAEA